ncbi:cupin domain-containing protein [Halorussus sp. MSC15.2]|uniref:cupin domain-containing protein n=1 Tax=Halorussus sp. MSC15.2 TaxID=2283638 RepID=UPI0013D092CF|nr:cupin domain-containing protein [Halorussus sp. MSC15.2]NEU55214.1 cupin domain-containing protein [Halorussus sp. MSC15.2]
MTDSEFRKVAVEDLPDAPNPTRHKKEVDEAVGATEFGFNVYVADPGQQLPWGEHRHPNHEELLYVVEGEIRVETPDRDHDVRAGEAFFVPPDAKQRTVATGEGPARVIAVGAPKADDGAVIEERCPECGDETDRDYEERDGGDTYVLYCGDCGTEVRRMTAGPE